MHPPRQTCWENYFTLEYLAQRHWTPKLFFLSVSGVQLISKMNQCHVHGRGGMTWPSAGKKWLIFCLFGRSFSGMTHGAQVGVEVQGPHRQQSSLGILQQPQPLAPWSQEKFQLWLSKARSRNLLLYPDRSCSQKSFAKPCLGSGGDRRRELGTNCTWS